MSTQTSLWTDDGAGFGSKPPAEGFRASIAREMRYLFSIERNPTAGRGISASGVAHSLVVCIIEDFHMSRGKGKASGVGAGGILPTFIDVKLSAEDRAKFVTWTEAHVDPVDTLQAFADGGYRVGVSWSGEHQTYTVSVTCRDDQSENNGLCMTSFSRSLEQAVLLAWFKHAVVCEFRWRQFEPDVSQRFG